MVASIVGIHTVASRLNCRFGGVLWELKGQAGLFANATYEADTHTQRATLGRFGAPDRHVRFTPDRLVLETDAGEVIEVRDNPRGAFAGHTNETSWGSAPAYFDAYALWTYLTQPFLYAYPDFVIEEVDPWEEDGESWRRLKVILLFPSWLARFNKSSRSRPPLSEGKPMPNKKPKLDAATAAVVKQVLAMPPKHNKELKVGRSPKEKDRPAKWRRYVQRSNTFWLASL